MRIEIAKPTINPFGGLNFVVEEIKKTGINTLIDSELGFRPSQSKYHYSDVFMALWLIFFSGGDCAEDIEEHLQDCFIGLPGVKIPSADTILRVQKELATEKQIFISDQGIVHEFNINMAMCKNLYKYLIEKFSKTFKFLKKNFRLKKFIFRFITVAAKWIKRGRQNTLKLYTDKPYEIALC